MNRLARFLLVGAVLALAALLAIPAVAQEEGAGGIIIEASFGGDPATLNPLLVSDVTSRDLAGFLYPGLLGVDPSEATIVQRLEANPEFQGGYLVDSWEVNEDGTSITFTMRQDFTWSDGVPVTTADIAYAWEVISRSTELGLDVPAVFITEYIDSVEIVDDYTFVVNYKQANCQAIAYAASLGSPLAPAHALGPIESLNDDPFNLAPTVFGGPFTFGELRSGEQTSLLANTDYPDGDVLPTGYILRNVPDSTVLVEQFLAGETSIIRDPAVSRRSDLRAYGDEGNATVYPYPGASWDYLALNLADPNNPQNALDENGNPIDQGHHPIFGDVLVRRAVSLAVDVDAIIEAAVFGEGDRMTSFIIPASWAYADDLPPIPYDPAAAAALLDEAGWVDDDNDPSTPRVAQGAAFAEDGTPLSFTLFTNEGNSRRAAVATVIQDGLQQIGFQVNFQTIDFNVLLDVIDGQTFDAIILGWRNGYPDDPDATQLFTTGSDIIGSGSNFTSFSNARFDELNTLANTPSETDGCSVEGRAPYYREMQEIFQQELPYVPLYTIGGMYAAQSTVQGFNPYPSQLYWNINSWSISAP
jgi:peptide/nickel transport system substrate-binding protein